MQPFTIGSIITTFLIVALFVPLEKRLEAIGLYLVYLMIYSGFVWGLKKMGIL